MTVSELVVPGVRLGDEFSCSCGMTHKVATSGVFLGDDLLGLLDRVIDDEDLQGPIILVTGRTTREIAGKKVEKYFSEKGYRILMSEASRADMANISSVEEIASRCKLAVAIGGGTVIDTSKYAAHRAGIPFISIPTTISHDGIASPVASIFIGSKRTSVMTAPPKTVLITTSIIQKSPPRLLASGCGDILAKTTALRDWLLGHLIKGEYFCRTTFDLTASAVSDLKRFIEQGSRDIPLMSSAAVKCGLAMTLAGSSRPCSGAEHLFSHYLDMLGEGVGMHGEQVGLGAILMATRYEDFESPPAQGFEMTGPQLRSYLSRVGGPTRLREIRVSEGAAVKALLECRNLRPERYTILHHAPLTPSGAKGLLERSGVI